MVDEEPEKMKTEEKEKEAEKVWLSFLVGEQKHKFKQMLRCKHLGRHKVNIELDRSLLPDSWREDKKLGGVGME